MNDVQVVERGCGKPSKDGLYLNVGVGLHGIPLEDFFVDPTVPVPESFKLSAIGMKLVASGEKNEQGKPIYHIFDHIGSKYYPNVMDWFMETQTLGLHRKISKKFPVHLLTPESLYYACHEKAGIKNPMSYARQLLPSSLLSPCQKTHQPQETCPRYFTNDLVGETITEGQREVQVKLPSVQYQGYSKPTDAKPKYIESVFMIIPIGKMANFKYYSDESKICKENEKKLVEVIPSFMGLEVINVK